MIGNKKISKGQLEGQNAQDTPLVDTNLVVAKETNLQSFAESIDHAALKQTSTGVSTTYVSTVVSGGTTFSQSAVTGEIHSDQGYFDVHGTGATNVTVNDLTATSTYVYYDNASVLQQQTTIPTEQDWNRKVFTMRISVDTSTNTIVNFEYLNNPIGHYGNTIRDIYGFLREQGVPFKKGLEITGRTDNLGFNIGAGSLLELGGTGNIYNANVVPFSVTNNKSYSLLSRTAIISSETNLVKFWDNNTVITALGSTTCVAHRVYMFSTGGVAIQYGQANYANMTLAKAGANLEPFVKNPVLKDATFMGWWVFEETATVTAGTIKAEFIEYTLGIQGGNSSNAQDLSGYLQNITDTFTGVLTIDGDIIITGETKVFNRIYTSENTLTIQSAGAGRSLVLNDGADTLTCTFDRFIAEGVKANRYIVDGLNTAPASATASGMLGEIRYTADYIYVCTATNTWKRTSLSTWGV